MSPQNVISNLVWSLIILMCAILFFNSVATNSATTKVLAYSDLLKEVDGAAIQKITFYSDGNVEGQFKNTRDGRINFKSNIGDGDAAFLSRKLESQNPAPEIIKETATPSFWWSLTGWLPTIVMISFLIFFMRQMRGGGNIMTSFGKSKAKLSSDSQKKITFKDVAGVEEAKAELQETIDFLREPAKFQKLGGRLPKGVLLMGPPGTGKTLLAKAVAGEANVPFFSISGSDFVEMFVGVGAARVRDLFEEGEKNAPCIIFIDEIDAVGRHRGAGLGGGHDEREQTLNALLVEMDGFEGNEGVIIIAASNRPDVLDPALLRPGRFDRRVVIDKPDKKGREDILKIHAQKVPLEDNINLTDIARGTPGFVGADLANLVNEAALNASRFDRSKVAQQDFEFAKDKIMMGNERKTLVISDEDKKTTAIHESGHALVSLFVTKADPLHKVTIIPRGMALGLTTQLPTEDHHNYSKEYLESRLAILMGGRCAEEIILNQQTTGAQNDIERATEIAYQMVCEWGMSELGPLNFVSKNENPFLGKQLTEKSYNCSGATAEQIDAEIKSLVNNACRTAKEIIEKNKEALERLVPILIEKETLEGEEVRRIIGLVA